MIRRRLQGSRRQRTAQLTLFDADGRHTQLLHAKDEPIDAPNWSPEARWLMLNCAGSLLRIRADGSGRHERIDTGPGRAMGSAHTAGVGQHRRRRHRGRARVDRRGNDPSQSPLKWSG